MGRTAPKLTSAELDNLDKKTLRELNLITTFYYDVIRAESHRGIIKKVTPRQFYEFIKRNKKATAESGKVQASEQNDCGG